MTDIELQKNIDKSLTEIKNTRTININFALWTLLMSCVFTLHLMVLDEPRTAVWIAFAWVLAYGIEVKRKQINDLINILDINKATEQRLLTKIEELAIHCENCPKQTEKT